MVNAREARWGHIAAKGSYCSFEMIGTRKPGRWIHYPVEPAAAKYGASASAPTDSPAEAYASWNRPEPGRYREGDLPAL